MTAPILKRVCRFDNIKMDETYYTEEGFLIDHPIVTTVGIFEYMNADGSIRRELRLPEEVFAEASLSSYEGKPIIVTHDAGVVTKENVEEEIIGTILSKGYEDGENVRVKIVIHDTDRMKQSGLRELSLGYNLELDETPGEWNGHPYDAIQRNITINHLALVSAARAGEKARLNIDGKENSTGGPEMEQNKTDNALPIDDDKVVAPAEDNDTSVELGKTEQNDEDVIQSVKDRRDRRDAEATAEYPESARETILQQDADIDALLKLIEQLKAKNDFNEANADSAEDDETKADCDVTKKDSSEDKSGSLNLDAAEIDKIVARKLEVIRVADRLNLDGVDAMSLKDGKKAVIKAVLPKLRLDGKSDDYINALYDMAKAQVEGQKSTDRQRGQMYNKDSAVVKPSKTLADDARQRMIERQKNGGNK